MKKLTAGIFSVLMGLVSVNAAQAAVASKGYVDTKVGVNTSSIETLTQTVADNKTAAETALSSEAATREAADKALDTRVTANETAVSNLQTGKADKGTKLSDYGITDAYTKNETDTEIAEAVQKTMDVDVAAALADYLKKTEAEGIYETIATATAKNEAQDTKITSNTDALTVLKGGATVEGSVAKSIADAITALDLANSYDAKGSAATAEQNAKDYADSLAKNYDAKGSAADAQAAAEATAAAALAAYKTTNDAAVSANTNAISAINNADTGILAQSKEYTDSEIGKLETSLNGTSTSLTELSGKVSANETAIQEINDSDVMKSGVTAATVGQVGTNATAIQTINDSAAMKSGITSEKVTAYDAYAGQISGAQGAADAAQADADAAAQAAAAAQATADKAIPAPTPECSNKGNKCVLTSGEDGYAWEVIERGTGEVIE